MKRHIKVLILAFALSLALVACGSADGDKQDDKDKNTTETKHPSEDSDEKETTDDEEGKDSSEDAYSTNGNFAFKSNDILISIDDVYENVLNQLGEPMKYFEAPSCAYQGLDKTYYYNGFEVTTYTDEKEVDHIASVLLVDDTVTTQEGIYIGSSVEDIIDAYGSDYEEATGQYTYIKGDSELQFIIKDDAVASIMYTKIL